jgi:hypothetical protein
VIGPKKNGSPYICVNGVFYTDSALREIKHPETLAEYIKSYPNDIYNLNNYQPDWIKTDENKFRLQYRNKTYIVGNTNNKVWVWLNGKFINHLFPK